MDGGEGIRVRAPEAWIRSIALTRFDDIGVPEAQYRQMGLVKLYAEYIPIRNGVDTRVHQKQFADTVRLPPRLRHAALDHAECEHFFMFTCSLLFTLVSVNELVELFFSGTRSSQLLR
jgi:hypothetical protein